jgi:HJR/Mrr/RecB family endonuclease
MSEHADAKPKRIFDHIVSQFPLNSCKELYTCIIEAINSINPGLGSLELYTTADWIQNSVRSLIDAQVEEYLERKLPPKVYWSELNSNRLVGRCFAYANDPYDVRAFKQRLLLIEQVRRAIALLSWDDFETFCRKFISLEPGYTRVRRKRQDGGIDFHGTYRVSRTHQVRFGGQAKKYGIERRIGPNLIRELKGSLRDYGYAFGVIMATCSFTEGARKYARSKSIDTLDGEQIAYSLIEKDICITVDGRPSFSEEEFRSWVRQ